jgi:hypothetical protein
MNVEPNGQEESGRDRLDRIERALDLILDDHILFRNEHKRLLAAQVLLTDGVEKLTAAVEAMRENFDARLKRLE